MIAELHCHTSYSVDCWMSPRRLVEIAAARGLSALVITDHETINGALHAQAMNENPNLTIIVGEERTTDVCDIIGLFLTSAIRSRVALDVIAEIKDQGGVAMLPHPCRGRAIPDVIVAAVDVIEIFNARTPPQKNVAAAELARQFRKPTVVGSDAHFYMDIARCRNVTPSNDLRADILAGRVTHVTAQSPRWVSPASEAIMRVKLGQYHRVPGPAFRALGRALRIV